MSKRALGSCTALVLAALSAGCVTTRDEGEAMRKDIAQLKDEHAGLQRTLHDEKAGALRKLDALEQRMAALEQTLGNLRQADADTGVQMEKLIAELQTLRGEVEEARHQLGETKRTVEDILARPPVAVSAAAAAPTADTPDAKIAGEAVPVEKQAHYDFAKKLFDDKKFAEAAEAFDLFLQRHSADAKLADNAAYWKGEAYFGHASELKDKKAKEKVLKQAILAYQRVLEQPKSEKGDGALMKIGLAFEQLGFKDEAKVFYEELIGKHPKSPLVGEAKKRLKSLGPSKKKK